MHKRRLNHLLAGAAVTAALALTASGNGGFAQASQPVPASEAASQASPVAPQAAPQPEAEKPTPAATAPAVPAPAKETTGNVQYKVASAEVDAQIADKLREISNGKFDRLLGGRKDRAEHRSVLQRAEFRAALDHQRRRQSARQRCHRLSCPCRRAWSRTQRLSDAWVQGGR